MSTLGISGATKLKGLLRHKGGKSYHKKLVWEEYFSAGETDRHDERPGVSVAETVSKAK